MKKTLLLLALVALATPVLATSNFGNVTVAARTAQYFRTGNAQAVSTNAATLVAYPIVHELVLGSQDITTAMTVELWDCPADLGTSSLTSLTVSTKAVKVATIQYPGGTSYDPVRHLTWKDGLQFKGFPALVQTDSGVNSPNARMNWTPGIRNPKQP